MADINLNLGSDITFEEFQKAVHDILNDVTKIREALRGLDMTSEEDARKAAKYLNEMMKVDKQIKKRAQTLKEEGGILGGLIKKQRADRSRH